MRPRDFGPGARTFEFTESVPAGGTLVADCRRAGRVFAWVAKPTSGRTITHNYAVEAAPANWAAPSSNSEISAQTAVLEDAPTGWLRWVADGSSGGGVEVTIMVADPGEVHWHHAGDGGPELSAREHQHAIVLREGEFQRLDVRQFFNYPHPDTLTFSVAETGTPTGTANESIDGYELVVTALTDGTLTERVTATAPHGDTATVDIVVRITDAPTLAALHTRTDIALDINSTWTFRLDAFFTLGAGTRTYAVARTSSSARGTSTTLSGDTLTITSTGTSSPANGPVIYRVTATDAASQTATLDIRVNVGTGGRVRQTTNPLPTVHFDSNQDSPRLINPTSFVSSTVNNATFRVTAVAVEDDDIAVVAEADGENAYSVTPLLPGNTSVRFTVDDGTTFHAIHMVFPIVVGNLSPRIVRHPSIWHPRLGSAASFQRDFGDYVQDPEGQTLTWRFVQVGGLTGTRAPTVNLSGSTLSMQISGFTVRGVYRYQIQASDPHGQSAIVEQAIQVD